MDSLRAPAATLALGCLLGCFLLVGGPAASFGFQDTPGWFPEGMLDHFAQKLAEQILGLDDAQEDEDAVVQKARSTLHELANNIERLGVEGLIEIAPQQRPDLELPGSGQPALDAVARWGLCSAFLQEVYHDVHGSGYGIDQRVSAAVGMAVLPLVSGPLREYLLAEGVSDEQMKAYLASEQAEALFERVWNDSALLDATRERCNPALARIFSGE